VSIETIESILKAIVDTRMEVGKAPLCVNDGCNSKCAWDQGSIKLCSKCKGEFKAIALALGNAVGK